MTSVKPGDRIRLVAMPKDPDPVPAGTTGTVTEVTCGPMGQISVTWDNLRRLVLLPDVDQFDVIGYTDLVDSAAACRKCGNRSMDLLVFDEEFEQVACSLCGEVYVPGATPRKGHVAAYEPPHARPLPVRGGRATPRPVNAASAMSEPEPEAPNDG